MVGALQFVILLPLFDVSMPANAAGFFETITKIASFDIFEIGDYVEALLSLLPTDPVNQKYESIGLESHYFINNLGSFIIALLVYATLALIWIITDPVIAKCPKKLHGASRRLGNFLFWNRAIGLVFESFLIVAICSLITFKYGFLMTGNYGQIVQTVTCLACAVFYCTLPVMLIS